MMPQNFLKTTRNFPLTTRFVLFVIVPLIAASWLIHSNVVAGFPPENFTLGDPALSMPASVTRDLHGVPHINAKSDADAFFSIGYVHAQDRLWQLELQRRIVQGRLSEVFGKESVPQDIWFRTLGLYAAAKTAWPALSKEAQASLTAYAAGVNAAMAKQHSLPPEFQVLNITPQPWTEIDSLAWSKMFALDLGGNFRKEIARFIANQSLTSEQVKTFFPNYPNEAPTTISHDNPVEGHIGGLGDLLNFQKDLENKFGIGGHAVGSNAWVVSGRHTENGASILANDPHLGLQIPSLWYAISAKGKSLNVAGMSLVGLPIVIFGHNEHIAWGGTSMMADVQDLFLEHSDQTDSNSYDANGSKEAFVMHTEEIAVRADFPEQLHKKFLPVKLHIRETRHGPVISDQFRVFDNPVSLRWTALDAGDTSYEAFYRLNFSNDWSSFNSALHMLVAPALNMVYADRNGNIGYLGAGRIPIRKKGDGSVPSSGWTDEYAWNGYIPQDHLPKIYNPASGYIVTANNKIVGSDYPYFISQDWASPDRAQRIEKMLVDKINKRQFLTSGDMQTIQRDTLDLGAQRLLTAMAGFIPKDKAQIEAWSYVQNWNGDMAADSQAAAIFQSWMRHFREKLFTRTLKDVWKSPDQENYVKSLGDSVEFDGLAKILGQSNSPWCAKEKNSSMESCQDMLSDSLELAIAEIYKLKGDKNMAHWKWGDMQTTVYAHTPFSNIRPFDKFFEQRIGNGGSENSINVAGVEFNDKEGYLQRFGPSFRQIINLSHDHIVHQYMNSTGQSGNPFNTHYSDMVRPFQEVHYYSLDSLTAEDNMGTRGNADKSISRELN